MRSRQELVNLSASMLLEALLIDFADTHDEAEIPIGRLLIELGGLQGIDVDNVDPDETVTAGELRARIRAGLAALAGGEDVP